MQREVRRREVNILRQGINLATPDLVAKESVVPARKRPIEPSPTINPIQSNEPEDNTGLAKQRKRHTAAPPGSPPNDDPQDGDGADINVIPSSSQPKSRATDHRHKRRLKKEKLLNRVKFTGKPSAIHVVSQKKHMENITNTDIVQVRILTSRLKFGSKSI